MQRRQCYFLHSLYQKYDNFMIMMLVTISTLYLSKWRTQLILTFLILWKWFQTDLTVITLSRDISSDQIGSTLNFFEKQNTFSYFSNTV